MAYQPRLFIKCQICGKRAVARKLCRSHYSSKYISGELKNFKILGPEDFFEYRYRIVKSGCWEWIGTKNEFGYGILLLPENKPVRAHRYSYERSKGKIPFGKVIMHICDNPGCVNPKHLKAGTRLDNNRDAAKKGRMPSGTKHWNNKLTKNDYQHIKRLSASLKQIEIAEIFKVDSSHISRIISGKR